MYKEPNRFNRIMVGILLLSFAVGGCSPANTSSDTPDQPIVTPTRLIPTSTSSPNPTPTLTFTPSATSTTTSPTLPLPLPNPQFPTSTPASQLNTPAPAKLASTPFPTLSVNTAKSLMLHLSHTNGGCSLPCVWGIVPGESNLQKLETFKLRFVPNISIDPEFYMDQSSHETTGGISFGLKKGDYTYYQDLIYYTGLETVEQLVLKLQLVSDFEHDRYLTPGFSDFDRFFPYYTLTNILSLYGKPNQVLVFPFPNPRTIDPDWYVPQDYRFTILLVYEEQGFLVVYDATREVQGEYYVGCPANALITLTTWFSQEKDWNSALELLGKYQTSDYNIKFFKNIAEATGMSLDEFYEFYRNPYHHGCLETPISIWE